MRNVAGLTLRGMTGAAVEVEAEITGGMPAFAVVGLPDTAVKEARERVRAALRTVNVLLRGARLCQPRSGRPTQGGRDARPADSRKPSPKRRGACGRSAPRSTSESSR